MNIPIEQQYRAVLRAATDERHARNTILNNEALNPAQRMSAVAESDKMIEELEAAAATLALVDSLRTSLRLFLD